MEFPLMYAFRIRMNRAVHGAGFKYNDGWTVAGKTISSENIRDRIAPQTQEKEFEAFRISLVDSMVSAETEFVKTKRTLL